MADLFLVTVTVKDSKAVSTARKRNTMPVGVYFPIGALTVAQITAKHDAVVSAIDGVSGAIVISSGITLFPDLPAGLKGAAEANSNVQDGGLFSFDLTDSNYIDSVFVPALKNALLNGDEQTIDVTDALVIALDAALSVEGGAANPASNRFGITYASLQAAVSSFRK